MTAPPFDPRKKKLRPAVPPQRPDPADDLYEEAKRLGIDPEGQESDDLYAVARQQGIDPDRDGESRPFEKRSDPRVVERAIQSLGKTPRLGVRPDQTHVTPREESDPLIKRVASGVAGAAKEFARDPSAFIVEELKEPVRSGLRAMNASVEGDIVSPATLRHGDPTGEKTRRVGTRITKENTPGALTREEARQARLETLGNIVAAPVGIGAAKLAKRAGVQSLGKRTVIGVAAGAAPVGAAYSPDDPLAGALSASVVGAGFGAAGPFVGRGVKATARGGAQVVGRGAEAARRGAAQLGQNARNVRQGISDFLDADKMPQARSRGPVDEEAFKARAVETLTGALPDEPGMRLRERPETEAPQPPSSGTVGGVQPMRVSEIGVDAARFQFKQNLDPESGTGAELRGVQKFNPTLAGVISVWRDPQTGKHWVVNGHHRLELARRTGQEAVNVQVLDAKTPEEARATGAMVNIAEGRGTSLDAGKLFRDTGLGAEALETEGVSLTGAIARNGLALSRLTSDVFAKVASGRIPEAHGVAIGRGLETETGQRAAATLVERSPKTLSTAQVDELIAQVRQAGEATFTQESLFGQEQLTQSLIYERAEVAAELRKRIEADRKLFSYVTRGERATELQRGGNVIDTEQSGRLAEVSAILGEAFAREAHSAGPVGSAITQAAQRVARGEKVRSVVDDIETAVKQALQEALEGRGATRGTSLEAGSGVGEPSTRSNADRGQEVAGESPSPEEEGRVRDSDDPNQSPLFMREPEGLRADDLRPDELRNAPRGEWEPPLYLPSGRPMDPERIVASAIRLKDGRIYQGEAHYVAVDEASFAGVSDNDIAGAVQGFITSRGQFVNRKQAVPIAEQARQLRSDQRPGPSGADRETMRRFGMGAEDMWRWTPPHKPVFPEGAPGSLNPDAIRAEVNAILGETPEGAELSVDDVLRVALARGVDLEGPPARITEVASELRRSEFRIPPLGDIGDAVRGLNVDDLKPGELGSDPNAPRYDVEAVRGKLAVRGGERITAASIRLADGRTFEGVNHADAVIAAEEAGVSRAALENAERGFATSSRPYVNRHDALRIALKADQLHPDIARDIQAVRRVGALGIRTRDLSVSGILGEKRAGSRLSADDVVRVAREIGLDPASPANTVFDAALQLEVAGYKVPRLRELEPAVQRLHQRERLNIVGEAGPRGRGGPKGIAQRRHELREETGQRLRLASRAVRTAEGIFEVEAFQRGGRWLDPGTRKPLLAEEGYLDSAGNFWTRAEAREEFGRFADVGPEGVSPTGEPLFDPSPEGGDDLFAEARRLGVDPDAPETDLFGETVRRGEDQPGLFGGKEGSESARSLAQAEVAARSELEKLRQVLALETDAKRKADVAQRIVQLEKLVNRNKAITPDEMKARAIAEASDIPVPPGPDQATLFAPITQPTGTGAALRVKAGKSPLAPDDIKSLQAISRGMAEALGVPLRQGRFQAKRRGALGAFFPGPEVIRVRRLKMLDTVAHEIGHYISKKYLRNPTMHGAKVRGAAKLTPAVRQELTQLGRDLYGNRKPAGGYGEEGLAQVGRFYVTEPARLLRDAPNAAAWFDAILANESALKGILDQGRADFERYMAAPDNAKVASLISVSEHQRVRLSWKGFIKHVIDDLREFKEATEALGKPKSAVNDAYILARLTKGDPARSLDMVERGVRDFNTRARVTRGLSEILADVGHDNLQPFREYIVSRQVITKTGQGIDTGFDVNAAQAVVQNADPRFQKLAQEVWDYRTALLGYLRDAGLLTPEEFLAITKKNPTPTPFYRVLDPNETGAKDYTGKTFARNSSGIRRMVGSDRPIVDPLESLIKDTFVLVSRAEKHNAAAVLIKQAHRTEGGGQWVEELPETPQEKRTVHVEKVLDQLAEMGFTIDANTLAPAQIAALQRGVLEAFYDKAVAGPREVKDLVLPVIIDGRRRWFQIRDRDLWDAIQRLDEQELQMWEKIMAVPTQGLRTGATLSPDFLGVNPLRDAFATSIYSKAGTRPPGWHFLRGVFELVRKGKDFDAWVAEGGPTAGMVGADRANMQRTLEEITRGNRSHLYRVISFPLSVGKAGGPASNWLHHPLSAIGSVLQRAVDPLRAVAELGENSNRLGEFIEVQRQAVSRGATQKAANVEAAFASRDLIDFRRAGVQSRVLNRLIAFWTAAVQDIDKFSREHNPANLTTAEGRARMLSVMGRATAFITLPSVALYLAQKDDPVYQEVPEYVKATGWVFVTRDENGEPSIWWLPRPHLLGIVYGYMPEKAMDFILENDPNAGDDLLEALYDYGTPPVIPTALRPLYENIRNKSTLTDRPIAPRQTLGLEKEMQSSPYTGETARVAGDVLNQSPAKIENLVSGWSGGLGREALRATDKTIRGARSALDKPPLRGEVPEAEGIEQIPLVRRFHIPKPGAGAESVGTVFELFGEAEQKRQTWRRLLKEGKREEAREYLTSHRDEIRSVATEEEGGPGRLRATHDQLTDLTKQRRDLMARPLNDIARRQADDRLEALMVLLARRYTGGLSRQRDTASLIDRVLQKQRTGAQ